MTDAEYLSLLKIQLQMLTDAVDPYLTHILDAAKEMISREGITADNSPEYVQIVLMQAAFLYNKRNTNEGEPRRLRYAKNNLLFAQKVNAE